MKITFHFALRPGDAQVEAVTVRVEDSDLLAGLGKAQLFVQSITTIPIARVTIDVDPPQS